MKWFLFRRFVMVSGNLLRCVCVGGGGGGACVELDEYGGYAAQMAHLFATYMIGHQFQNIY